MRTTATLFLACILTIASTSPAKACVDNWPPTIIVTVDFDANFTEALITVSNLSLFGGPNGAFCSCAVATWTDMFSNLQYIAFVDSGTYNPVAGFAAWDASTVASSAWGNVQSGDWNGFIAEVVGPGISTGTPVELLIRATLPPGYTFSHIDTSITQATAGTDEWSATANDLAFSHNSVASLGTAQRTYITQPLSFFASVDSLVTAVPDASTLPDNDLLIWSEGSSQVIAMQRTGNNLDLQISDLLGRSIVFRSWNGSPFTIPEQTNDILLIHVRSDENTWTRKLMSAH